MQIYAVVYSVQFSKDSVEFKVLNQTNQLWNDSHCKIHFKARNGLKIGNKDKYKNERSIVIGIIKKQLNTVQIEIYWI